MTGKRAGPLDTTARGAYGRAVDSSPRHTGRVAAQSLQERRGKRRPPGATEQARRQAFGREWGEYNSISTQLLRRETSK